MSDNPAVFTPQAHHHCNMGWELRPLPADALARKLGAQNYYVAVHQHNPAGTIRQCAQCGKTWVAYDPPKVSHGMQSVTTQWRPEGRFERWRRQKNGSRLALRCSRFGVS